MWLRVSTPLIKALDTLVGVLIDYPHPDVIMDHLRMALPKGIACVIGTTGLSEDNLSEIDETAKAVGIRAGRGPGRVVVRQEDMM